MKGFKSFGLILCFVFSVSLAFSAENVTVMTYNVENLFDTVHDEGKDDWTYLPLEVKKNTPEALEYCQRTRNPHYRKECLTLDWSDSLLATKIKQISKVIKSYNNGQGPDILVVQEVENLNALTKLRDQGLEGMGYKEVVLLEGPDNRGIDVGIISRFPLDREPKLHEVDFTDLQRRTGRKYYQTRGILEATFNVNGKLLTVFGNHWSSQANPHETRMVAAETLARAASRITDSAVIATGDFNTTESDNPHGINEFILNSKRPVYFLDAEHPEMNLDKSLAKDDTGSHWYRGKWESLDRIFLLSAATIEKDLSGSSCSISVCLEPRWESFKFHKPSFLLKKINYQDRRSGRTEVHEVPWRFEPETGKGYSDHLPVTLRVALH